MNSYLLAPGIRLIILIAIVCLAIGAIQTARSQSVRMEHDDALLEHASLEARLSLPTARSTLTANQWASFGKQISKALASDHDGLQQGALRMLIKHGQELDVPRATALDAVRIYRNHASDNMRRMAVVALGRMREPWSMDFLRRSFAFEKSPAVRHTLGVVVATYYGGRLGDVEVGAPERVE